MAVLVLNQEEVERLLDMEGCIEAMADALASLARGEVHVPLRFLVAPENEPSLIGLMPAHRAGESPLYLLKTVCVFPDNPQRGLDAHQGIADGAGALAPAAALSGRAGEGKLVCIVSGGNIDFSVLSAILAGGTPT